MKIFAVFFILFPLIFLGIGGYLAHQQAQKIARVQPVQATVLSKRVEVSRNSDNEENYRPIVEFSFDYQGQTHTAENVSPIRISSSKKWADGIIRRYTVGQNLQAWADPKALDESFLERKASFFPYIFVLFPMIFVAVGVSMFKWTSGSPNTVPLPGDAQSGTEGWYLYRPKANMAARLKNAIITAMAWNGVGILATAHFLSVGTGLDNFSTIALPIYFALGMIPIGMVIYRFRVRQLLHDAVVMLETEHLQAGQDAQVFVEQFIKAGCQINALKLGLKCQRTVVEKRGSKTSYRTQAVYEQEDVIAENQTVSSNDALHLGHTLTVPEGVTGTTTGKSYPRIRWMLTVHTDIANAPDYRAEFPVHMNA